MREIKFRVWEKNLREIIPVNNINFESKMINTDSVWRLFKEIELMQYTGLKDKNGKEIYEGDVVKTEDGVICKIVYDEASFKSVFSYKGKPHNSILDKLFVDMLIPEIIGNIYEDPELIN